MRAPELDYGLEESVGDKQQGKPSPNGVEQRLRVCIVVTPSWCDDEACSFKEASRFATRHLPARA